MIIRVTGNERDVANSAWVSTLKEVRAQAKTQEDVEGLVEFLVEHRHTSPFESVTITMEPEEADDEAFIVYGKSPYAVSDYGKKVTIDLLNFIKITFEQDLWNYAPWKAFSEVRPTLAKLISDFGPIQDSTSEDVTSLLGENHGMTVELVHLHDEEDDRHSRATWRIKCPLSIAVQILRHRKGSYNMVSGRYKTIRQEMYEIPDDVRGILEQAGGTLTERFDNTLELVQATIDSYLLGMQSLRVAKKEGMISNDAYKRAREYVRFILPEGRMTELYVTYYLSDFYGNYKKLRDSVHAQTEHIWIAQEMARTIDLVRQED